MDQSMPSEREIFSLTGPTFLNVIDWGNSHHRRSVAASLVQGVYSLEHDRRQNRQGDQALAPPWWQPFKFRLFQVLVDKHDASNFGAIYELNRPFPDHPQRHPRYVVAFRGTIKKTGNWEQDIKLNLHSSINNLAKCSRFKIGLDCVHQIVQNVGPENVWIAGHSLGSSIALLVGRQMVKQRGTHLETYLFNPPFLSLPIERLSNKLKFVLRLANSFLTAGLAAAVNYGSKKTKDQENDPFVVLSTWVPNLFINPSDPICSEYEGYFEHRDIMESIGARRIGKLATKHSIASILARAAGKKDCEAVHLIPSAYLTVNVTPCRTFKEAHGINQWWRQNGEFRYKLHQYK